MYKRINSLCKEKGTNVTAMCKALNVARSSLSELNRGRTKSLSYDYISKIANYFNVNPDYIAGKTEQKEKPFGKAKEPDITFNDFTYALHNETKELTEENKQKLLEMARFFKEQQDKEKNK